ncbi:MAG: hypothetical protein H0U03_08535 [Actinobacteria bacterium]|nr:hypothetical protein [Actinomycetota bacterium]
MATTLSWDGLRELAGFRAKKGCAISFYVNLDPSVSPTPADAHTRVNSLLAGAAKADGASPEKLTHDQREALKQDFERIDRYFQDDFVRDGARGAVVFSAGLDDLWVSFGLPDSVSDAVKVGRQLYLAPIVPLVSRSAVDLVAVFTQEQGQVYRLRAGRLENLVDRFDEQPGQHDHRGSSQARHQRHVEHLVQQHLEDVAGELDRELRRLRNPRLVVICQEEARPDVTAALSSETQKAVVGWAEAAAHATPAQLLEVVEPVLEQASANEERDIIERWREQAGRDARGSSGWAETLAAASDARVDVLLFQEGVNRPCWQCAECGRLSAEAGACPLDGSHMDKDEAGLDLAVHQTLAQGGTVLAVRHHQDLDPVEGIGALLRF